MSQSDEYQDEVIGANESTRGNAIFVNLRIGKLAQTDKREEFKNRPGWFPASTVNQAGVEFKFMAHPYDDLCGFVKDIKWHEKTFEDGSVTRGWWIILDIQGQEYIIDLKKNDRPFNRTMAVLVGLDFARPIRFSGFMGKNKQNGKPQKVLLLYQGKQVHPETGKPVDVKPFFAEKWLDLKLVDKLKANPKAELTDQEKNNLKFKDDGKIDGDYPYIRQNQDKTWNFDAWTNFLIGKMRDEVIPNVQAAQAVRNELMATASAGTDQQFTGLSADDDTPEPPSGNVPDDDIPF